MPLSDMLFANTHNVEQLVDIRHKKSVDKVLLKVIKTVRERASITNWVKPTSDLRKDFHVTDRQMKSICSSLGSYYNVYLDPEQMHTPGDIIGMIKTHKAQATDSLYLIDCGSMVKDDDDELEPKENLEVKPEVIKKSEASTPTEVIDIPDDIEVSTEEKDKVITDSNEFLDSLFGKANDDSEKSESTQKEVYFKLIRNYPRVCTIVNQKMKDDNELFHHLHKVHTVKMLNDAFAKLADTYKKIKAIPRPDKDEDPRIYKDRVIRAIGSKKLEPIKLGPEVQMSWSDAGYFDAAAMTKLIKNSSIWWKDSTSLRERFDKVDPKYRSVYYELNIGLPYVYFGDSPSTYRSHFGWTEHFYEYLKSIVTYIQKKYGDILSPGNTTLSVAKESWFDAVLVGGGVAAVAVTIVKLCKERNWDKLVEYMSANYEKICADIRKNHKDDPAFKKNRAILYPVDSLKNAFAARTIQLKKINDMPLPHFKENILDKEEDLEQYKAKLYAYFGPTKPGAPHPVMEHRVKPGEPSYLTIEEAGYLNSMNVRALINKIKECFDLQDAVDKKLLLFVKKRDGETYKDLLASMKILDHFHALYKEEWTEHFSTHVMKSIVNGLEGKPNDKIGSEQLKVEASMETLAPKTEETPSDWGSMMDTF